DPRASGALCNSTPHLTGREHDADGLYDKRARYYHPVFSRFVSEDPIGFGAGHANLYEYVGSNPVTYSDPSGRIAPLIVGALICGIGALAGGIGYGVMAGRKRSVGGFLLTAAAGCAGALVGFFVLGGGSLPSLGLLASRFAVGAVATGAAAVPAAQRIGLILQSYGVTGAQKFLQLEGTVAERRTHFSL